jgi:transketolase
MEGASNEAASVAGHFKLGKLVWVYDENHISIEGKTELTYSDNVQKRFEGYNWYVQDIGDNANNLDMISEAFENATGQCERPSLIILRSHIGYGAPNKHDTKEAHGEPLGEDEVRAAKKFYGWPDDEHFYVPPEADENRAKMIEKGRRLEHIWQGRMEEYKREFPDMASQLQDSIKYEMPESWDSGIPAFKQSDGPMATRDAGGKVLNAIAKKVEWLMGGSGDLAPSTKTLIKDEGYFEAGQYQNRNIAWGIREHCMCAASSGLCLHG